MKLEEMMLEPIYRKHQIVKFHVLLYQIVVILYMLEEHQVLLINLIFNLVFRKQISRAHTMIIRSLYINV